MKKFIVLYYAPTEAREKMQNSTPEEMKNGMAPWMEWKEKLGEGLVEMGTPLGNAMKVTNSGVVPGDANVIGYSVLQAENIDAAVLMVKEHPHLKWTAGCEIEVYESLPTPGM